GEGTVDVSEANRLFEVAERLATEAAALREALELEFLNAQVTDVVTADYDLGEVLRVRQILGGTENLSFGVVTRGDAGERRDFVRKYKFGTVEREIRYEHALVGHIRSKGFDLAAEVLATRRGDTLVTREELRDGERVERFFAVYEMLGGEDAYTWTENRCTDAEYEDGARVLARFHAAAHDFDPGGLYREQPPIMDFLATLPQTFRELAARTTGTKYDAYFVERLPGILEAVERGLALAPELEGLPRCPVFCDYHPGNLKWRDEKAVGLFDFDWAKLDYRVFDVAVGLVYFCSSWEGADDGEMRLDKMKVFLNAYQDEAARLGAPGPMGADELAVLPRMLAIAALYVVNWDIVAYYKERRPNDDEFLFFLEHNVAFVEYIEDHFDEIAAMAAAATRAAPGRGGEGA
ncbi:MAG: phosphotransferase, partial [Thermoleophilia bacterium]|nr:phosphotransferase [Thermoleophilia bacterium]